MSCIEKFVGSQNDLQVLKQQVCIESGVLSADPAEAALAARLRGVMRKCGDSLRSVNTDLYTLLSSSRAVSGARLSPILLSETV